MKYVIISDMHDNYSNLIRVSAWCENNRVNKIICCGDLTNNETLRLLSDCVSGPIHLIRGNADVYDEDAVWQYNNICYYGRIGRIRINNINIGICHEPNYYDKVLAQGQCDTIFYGHTHKPWFSEKKYKSKGRDKEHRVRLVNPGNLGGLMYQATFAVWTVSSNRLELIVLNQ
jgi:putative phosphoesterase